MEASSNCPNGLSCSSEDDTSFWWSRPVNIIKVNFDGAWSEEDGSMGLGLVARDSNGSLVAGSANKGTAISPLESEARAAHLAVEREALGFKRADW